MADTDWSHRRFRAAKYQPSSFTRGKGHLLFVFATLQKLSVRLRKMKEIYESSDADNSCNTKCDKILTLQDEIMHQFMSYVLASVA